VIERKGDLFGLAAVGLGVALIYAALDQGDRLDWFNSGLITGLLIGGGILLTAFIMHQSIVPDPWIDLHYVASSALPILLVMVAEIRFALLSTSFLIPQYLINVLGYRALQVGGVLVWIAIPQLAVAPLAGLMLRHLDARISAALGIGLIGFACWMVGTGLTAAWGAATFLPSQFIQAIGQTLAVSSIVFVGVLRLRPADALTFGAMLQMARLLGGELGLAAMTTFVRKSEQTASNIITSDVTAGAYQTGQALQGLAGSVATRSSGAVEASSRAGALMGNTVRAQAHILSYIEGFMVLVAAGGATLLLLAMLPTVTDHPAKHLPLFRRQPGAS
jgi:DHA2 family multidrug resistance protein